MKMILLLILPIIFCFSTPCICADSQSISIINKNYDSKEEVISQLLDIQKSLIVPVNDIPESYQQTGFLLVPMTPDYILSLLENKGGQIVCCFLDHVLVGYIILTEASEFKELYQDPVAGRFEMVVDSPNLNAWLSDNDVGYIEQIGIKLGYSRLGIGTQLIEAGKQLKPHGLISDVFIYPVVNTPSLRFFASQGFISPGILYQFPSANANFPYEHRTQVFFWNGIN